MPKKHADNGALTIAQRIHEAYSGLPEGERRIADAILANPAELAVFTASELAGEAGVSNATVSRFFQRLDYSNFEEARQDARRMRALGSPLFTGGKSTTKGDPISELARNEAALLEATLSRLNPLTVKDICQAIASAPRIRTLGFRSSHFLAQYLTAQLAQIRPGVSPLLLPGQTQSEGISSLGKGDLAIIVGLRRRPSGFARAVEEIAERGASILLITDQTVRAAPALATWSLECVVETPQFADSYVGALSVLRLLVLEARRALGEAGRIYLEEVEELRGRLGELE